MRKTLIAACLAIAAFAVVPSLASAKPVVTHPTGTIMAVHPAGKTCTEKPEGCILATNIGETTMTTSIGDIHCSTAILTGELTQNNAANGFKGTITSAKFGGDSTLTIPGDEEPECTTTGILGNTGITATPPYCVEGVEANDKLKVRGGACSEAVKNVTFKMTVTGPFGITVTCSYAKASLTGTFQTDTEAGKDATVTFSEETFLKTEGGGECPESGKLNMKFTLETDTPVATPIYFSE
jgi:hypothetical protein